jgi:hypothetical protein
MTGYMRHFLLFVRLISHAVLRQDSVFGGKEKPGGGPPEGLPLIFRFSPG